jgi:hypothetical protein
MGISTKMSERRHNGWVMVDDMMEIGIEKNRPQTFLAVAGYIF